MMAVDTHTHTHTLAEHPAIKKETEEKKEEEEESEINAAETTATAATAKVGTKLKRCLGFLPSLINFICRSSLSSSCCRSSTYERA